MENLLNLVDVEEGIDTLRKIAVNKIGMSIDNEEQKELLQSLGFYLKIENDIVNVYNLENELLGELVAASETYRHYLNEELDKYQINPKFHFIESKNFLETSKPLKKIELSTTISPDVSTNGIFAVSVDYSISDQSSAWDLASIRLMFSNNPNKPRRGLKLYHAPFAIKGEELSLIGNCNLFCVNMRNKRGGSYGLSFTDELVGNWVNRSGERLSKCDPYIVKQAFQDLDEEYPGLLTYLCKLQPELKEGMDFVGYKTNKQDKTKK